MGSNNPWHLCVPDRLKTWNKKYPKSLHACDPNACPENHLFCRFGGSKSQILYRPHTGTYKAPIPVMWTPNHTPKVALVWSPYLPLKQSYDLYSIDMRKRAIYRWGMVCIPENPSDHGGKTNLRFRHQNELHSRYNSNLPCS